MQAPQSEPISKKISLDDMPAEQEALLGKSDNATERVSGSACVCLQCDEKSHPYGWLFLLEKRMFHDLA